MAAGHEQKQIGKMELGVAQHRRQRVALEMIERDQRLAGGQRQPFGGHEADHHSPDQAGTGGGGDGVDLSEIDPCFGQNRLDQPRQNLDVRTGRNFGDNPSIRAMRLALIGDAVCKNAPVGGDQSRRGLVAARFDAEDQAHRSLPCHCRSV